MQREILFRGKRKDSPTEWVYGYYVQFYYEVPNGDYAESKLGHFILSLKPNGNPPLEEDIHYEILPETLGQYTGVKDINSVQIFEGDIVHVYYGVGIIVFHAGCFMIEWLEDKDANMELLSMKDYKTGRPREDLVVGKNIHDSPELLK